MDRFYKEFFLQRLNYQTIKKQTIQRESLDIEEETNRELRIKDHLRMLGLTLHESFSIALHY